MQRAIAGRLARAKKLASDRSAALAVLVAFVGIGCSVPRVDEVRRTGDRLHARAAHGRLGISLPDGSTLLLRREYRAFYRSLVMSRDGLLLDKAYHASCITSGSSEA